MLENRDVYKKMGHLFRKYHNESQNYDGAWLVDKATLEALSGKQYVGELKNSDIVKTAYYVFSLPVYLTSEEGIRIVSEKDVKA